MPLLRGGESQTILPVSPPLKGRCMTSHFSNHSSAFGDVLSALKPAKRLVVTTHLNSDGDGCGSAIALVAWARAQGKDASIITPTPYPTLYRYLLPDAGWVIPPGDEAAKDACKNADLAVVVDTGEVPRIGRVRPMIEHLPTVVIDHHPLGGRPIEGVSLRVPEAAAAGELVFELIHQTGGPWSVEIAQALYAAILTDTGGFRFSNTTANTLRIAADLVDKGVNPEAAHRSAYGAIPLRRLRLLSSALATLEVGADGRVAWMTIPRQEYERLGIQPDDLDGVVDYPRGVDGVEVGLLFRTTQEGGTKISFRSNGPVDVNELARGFGGGGHARAAGAHVNEALEKVRAEAVEATCAAVRETLGDPTHPEEDGTE